MTLLGAAAAALAQISLPGTMEVFQPFDNATDDLGGILNADNDTPDTGWTFSPSSGVNTEIGAGLTYPNMTVSGGSFQDIATGVGGFTELRSSTAVNVPAGGSAWGAFLFRMDGATIGGNSGVNQIIGWDQGGGPDRFGLEIEAPTGGGAASIWFGVRDGSNGTNVLQITSGSPTDVNAGDTNLILFRIDDVGADDNMVAWLNPDLSLGLPSDGSATWGYAAGSVLEGDGYNFVGDGVPLTFVASTADLTTVTMDQIQLNVVPEPATYALLLGIACLGLVVYRRRKAD